MSSTSMKIYGHLATLQKIILPINKECKNLPKVFTKQYTVDVGNSIDILGLLNDSYILANDETNEQYYKRVPKCYPW